MVGGNITQCAVAEFCHCCQCKHFVGVRKLVELKKGLTVYHAPREVEKEDETKSIQHQVSRSLPKLGDQRADTRVIQIKLEHVKKTQADDKMVFIIHNTNCDEIPSEEFLPEFDINSVKCPRCQYIMNRAKTLLENLPTVGKNMIRCVCDLCTLQQRSRVPCHFCQSIVKQFLATGIRDERIKEHFMSFLANAARNLSIHSRIEKYKEKKLYTNTVTIGINKIDDLVEIRKSNFREKDMDSTSKKLEKEKKVTIKTSETAIPTEDLLVDGNKDTEGKLSTIKLHPVIKPYSDEGLYKQVTRNIEGVKQSLFHSEQIPCKSFSDTVLGIGTTGLKQLSSPELSLSLAIEKAALKGPMEFFFPRKLKEKKMKLDETSYFDLIKDTKKRLKAEADEKLIKGKESTIAEKSKLFKSEKKYNEKEGDEFKENETNTENAEIKKGSKGIKSGKSQSTPQHPFSEGKIGTKTKIGEENIRKDYQKKETDSSKVKEGGIKGKGETERKKSKGKSKEKESTFAEKKMFSKLQKKYDDARAKKRAELKKNERSTRYIENKEGSKGVKSVMSGKSKGTPLATSSRGKSEVKTRKTKESVAKLSEKHIEKDYKQKGIESSKIKEGGIKGKGKTIDYGRVLAVIGGLQKKEGPSKNKTKIGKENRIMEKSHREKSAVTINKEKILLKDEQVHTVDEEKGDQKEELRKTSTVKAKMLKTAAIKAHLPLPRGQKFHSANKKQGLPGKIEKIPAEGDIQEELKLLNQVIEKHENAKIKSLKLKVCHEKKTKTHRKEADKQLKLLQKAGNTAKYIDIRGKRDKYVQIEKSEPVPELEKKGMEVKLTDVKFKDSYDDLILKLIQMHRQQTHLRQMATVTSPLKGHRIVKFKRERLSSSDDDDIDSDRTDQLKVKKESDTNDIVFGNTIITKQDLPPPPEPQAQPILFQFVLKNDEVNGPIIKPATTTEAVLDTENKFGVFKYALSDHTFIENGWTMLPVEKIIRKMNVYRMRPAQPEFDWFERNKDKAPLFYDSGEKLAIVTDTGRGQWYYKNGRLALDYYNAEDLNAQQRFVIYSSGDIDAHGHSYPVTVLGMFDFKGNGVVFDHKGKIRLKYNQTEGVVLDRGLGPVCHWLWHSLNEPPVLQQVMIDTRLPFTDPTIYAFRDTEHKHELRHNDETMAALEYENYVKTTDTKLKQKFTPHQINMKALKINEQFSLKVLDQKTVYLIFREGANTMRLNLGMILDHTEVVDTTSAELGEVSLNMEEKPAKTASVAELQKSLLNAKRVHRLRTERVLKKRPLAPGLSIDKLTSATSKPPRAPLMTTNVLTNYTKCETPIANDLYTNTRLI